MIVDTSALIAILFEEPEAQQFASLIHLADVCRISVVTQFELWIVLERQGGSNATRHAETFLRAAPIVVEPVTLQQGVLARQGFLDFGRGRLPARLNFGDCFSYALAKAMRETLLFKGDDFAQTDVVSALG